MGYINSLKGFSGLGKLNKDYTQKIKDNSKIINKLLSQENEFRGLGYVPETKEKKKEAKKLLSFDDVMNLYNGHISKEEIQAWVWYKRSLGVPMNGWDKYYLKGESKQFEIVVSTKAALVYANNFKPLQNVEANTILGKFVKQHDGDQAGKYNIYRSDDGLRMIKDIDSKITKNGQSASESELNRLVKSGALYYLDGELLPYPVYSFGNMFDRELSLRKDQDYIIATYGKDVYENHAKVIKESKPEMLTITSPDPKMRPIITAISDFAIDVDLFNINHVREEYMDVESATQFKKVNGEVKIKTQKEKIKLDFDGINKYSLTQVFCAWLYTLNSQTEFKKSSAIDIVDYYIFNKALRDDKLSAADKTELKANARNEGEELFAKFLNEVIAFEDQQRLDFAWNREYNGWSDISYKKIPIGFECSAYFKSGILQFTEAQREGVAFQESQGSGINAYDVGVGKTMTAIANLANQMYQGKAKRPLVVVPKPTYEKWMMEIAGGDKINRETGANEYIYGVLSGTKVQMNDWFNLGKESVKGLDLTKPVKENTITIVTYEGFKKLGMSRKVSGELLVELINILGQSQDKSVRDKEIDYNKYMEMLGRGNKGSIADIDTLGFDYLIIDEAHRCKNVFASVKADEDNNKRYQMTSATSETGIKAFLHANYLQRKYGKNIMLLTATPFTNSPLEIYSMLSLVAHESLVKQGLLNIDTFFDMFVLPTTEWAANYKEEITEKEVIKSFINRNILSRIIYNHILYKTGEEAGIRRPCKINIPLLYEKKNNKSIRIDHNRQVLSYLNMTPKQREQQNGIIGALKAATHGQLNTALLFKALNASLDNALSPFLYHGNPKDYKEFVEESPKIKYVIESIESVKKWHESRKDKVSGQVIYMNRGKAFFPYIKEYLIKESGFKQGVLFDKTKVDEVEILTSEIAEHRKETVKEAFLEGVVKVIIGTATIREGIDLQKNGSVIYNCYPEWNPTDIRQLEGRIWRQGNKYGYVRIVMPLVQDSMDVFVFQKLEEKTARINDIWFRGNRGNVLDLESLDPQEIKLALITDVNRLVAMFFDQEIQEKEREFKRLYNNIEELSGIEYDIRSYKDYRNRNVSQLINQVYPQFKTSEYFTNPDKFTKDQLKRANECLKDIESFIESSEREDNTLFALFRRIVANNYGYEHYTMGYFKEYTSKVRKTERNILKPKGYDINSNLAEVKIKYIADLANFLRASIIYIGTMTDELKIKLIELSDEELVNNNRRFSAELIKGQKPEQSARWKSLLGEIKQKKSALAITGKTPEERAQEFAKLNYLLKYRLDEVDSNSCVIPDPERMALPPSNNNQDDKSKRIRIAKAKAQAKIKLLKLLNS